MKLSILSFFIFMIIGLGSAFSQPVQWQRELKIEDYKFINLTAIIETEDGCFFLIADNNNLLPYGSGSSYFIKTNKYGEIIWNKNIGDPSTYFSNLQKFKNHYELFYEGNDYNPQTPTNDINFFVKKLIIDNQGNFLSKEIYTYGRDSFLPFKITTLNNGEYIVSGSNSYWGFRGVHRNAILKKYNSKDDLLWEKSYSYDYNTSIQQVIPFHNHFLILGKATPEEPTLVKYTFLLKTNNHGDSLSFEIYPNDTIPVYSDLCWPFQFLPSGNMVTMSNNNGEISLLLTDSNGHILRKKLLFGDGTFNGEFLLNPDSTIYIYSISGFTAPKPFILRKYDFNFNLLEERVFDYNIRYWNQTVAIFRTKDGGTLLAGHRNVDDGDDSRIILIKLAPIQDSTFTPPPIECSMAYPNPATTYIHIDHAGITDLKKGDLYIDIYATDGRLLLKIKTIRNQDDIDISSFSPGFYLYRLYDKDKIYCRKKFIKK